MKDPETTYRVYLLGASLGTGNRGVSALAASLVGLILRNFPGSEIGLLDGRKTSEPFYLFVNGNRVRLPVVNCRMSPRSRLTDHLLWILLMAILYRLVGIAAFRRRIADSTPWIDALVKADFVGEIRGGDSFSDIYGLRRFIEGTLPVLTCILVRGKVALLPQTYGPFKSPIARKLARYVLRHGEPIMSRDRQSEQTIRELAGEDCQVLFCPDVAFSLERRLPARYVVEPSLEGVPAQELTGLNVNGLMYRGGYSQNNMFELKLDYPLYLVRLAEAILADPNRHLLLVPHTFAPPHRIESDPAACLEVRARLGPELQKRTHVLEGEYDQNEIKGIIGLCSFFVGSRMHACIAALSQGIPTVGVAYSKKFSGVFETVGMGQAVIDGRACTTEQALQKTLEVFKARQSMRGTLETNVKQTQAKLQSAFERILHSKTQDLGLVQGQLARGFSRQ